MPAREDRLAELREEYAQTGGVLSGGAVWLFAEIVVLRDRVERLASRRAEQHAQAYREAAEWLRAEYTGPGVDLAIRRAADRIDVRADEIERTPAPVRPLSPVPAADRSDGA